MFRSSSVVVLGAGASKEVKLPVGSELKSQIANRLMFKADATRVRLAIGDSEIYEALRLLTQDVSRASNAARLISRSMPMASSIDNFIDSHRGNRDVEICGKLAIIQCILAAEASSLLHPQTDVPEVSFDHGALAGTWYNSFMQLLTENCTADEVGERLSRITFIVFNYDRCLEQYLFHSLMKFYELSRNDAAELMRKTTIYHPYGTVGSLPWQADDCGSVAYGEPVRAQELAGLASRIKTFTEGVDPHTSDILQVRQALRDAAMVIYLGFGFHNINLKILFDQDAPANCRDDGIHFATGLGISSGDCNQVRDELRRLTGVESATIDVRAKLTCAGLFGEYWRRIALN